MCVCEGVGQGAKVKGEGSEMHTLLSAALIVRVRDKETEAWNKEEEAECQN